MNRPTPPPSEIVIHRESYLNWELLVVLIENLGLYEYRITPPGKTSTRPNAHTLGAEWRDKAARTIGRRTLRRIARCYTPVQFGGDF